MMDMCVHGHVMEQVMLHALANHDFNLACRVCLKPLLAQSLATIMADTNNAMIGILPRASEITTRYGVNSALATVKTTIPNVEG